MTLQPWVIVADPEDAQRIAAHHVKKAGLYQGSFLGEGVLAQTNVEEWQTQRHHLLMGVLPMASLQQVTLSLGRFAQVMLRFCSHFARFWGRSSRSCAAERTALATSSRAWSTAASASRSVHEQSVFCL